MSKTNIQKLVEENVGVDKVIVHNKPYEDHNKWWITYQEAENKPVQKKAFDDYLTAWLWFTDNGGKNLKTVASDERFLTFNKEWDFKDFEELGHTVYGISMYGMIQVSESTTKITIPCDCGFSTLKNAVKLVEGWEIAEIKHRANKRTGAITRYFNSAQEFEYFKEWLFKSKELKNLIFYVQFIKTKSAHNECLWKRERAKDGTSRMQLSLEKINNKSYKDITFREVLNAAGDMAYTECEVLDHKSTTPNTQKHCRYAIERGDIAIALDS